MISLRNFWRTQICHLLFVSDQQHHLAVRLVLFLLIFLQLDLPPNQAINKQNENLLDAGVAPKSSLRVRFTGEIRLKPAVSQQLESYEKADEVLRHW